MSIFSLRCAVVGLVLCVLAALTATSRLAAAESSKATSPGLATIGGVPKLGGIPGKVSVVASGTYDNYLPVVVKNNTKTAVADVSLSGVARSGTGKLLATGEDQGVQPEVVPPGGLAIGYVYFHGTKLPDGARFLIDVSSTPSSKVQFQTKIDVPIRTLRYVSGRVVGIAYNSMSKKVTGPLSVYAACLNAANRLVAFESGYADKDDLTPKQQAPFTLDLTSFGTQPAPTCRYLLVSMRGYSF